MKWKIGWGISNRCNMHCKFCYSKEVRKEANFEENIERGIQFIIENQENIDSINFGTGEPTIEPEFFECCDRIRRQAPHITIGLTTNGSLAKQVEDPHKLEIFLRCIDDVDVSLDYGDRERQDESRSFPGAFDNAIASLKLCQKYRKNASVVNALHKYNCTTDNIDALMRIARLYDASLRINIYRPTVGFDFALSYEQLKEAYIHMVKKYEIESIADPLFASLIGAPNPDGDPVGRSSFRILPNGFITPSTYLVDEQWRVMRLDQVKDINSLSDMPGFKNITESALPEKCRGCRYENSCQGGVIDRRWLWYHDLSERDPYCPFENEDEEDWLSKTKAPIFSREKKSFVHDGYLPTLIFHPKVNEREWNEWDRIYQDSAAFFDSQQPDEWVKKAADLLKGKGKRAVDLGAGMGRNGRYILEQGNQVTFVESSCMVNDVLMKKLLESGMNGYEIIEKDIRDYLACANKNDADLIVAMHVLSHGSKEEIQTQYIDAIYELLKPHGIFVATLPSTKDVRCEGKFGETITYALTEGPEKGIVHSFFSREAVCDILKEFEDVELEELTDEKGNAHWFIIAHVPEESKKKS